MANQYEVGFTAGVWDLLHPGHIAFLAACKSDCDHLVVGLQTNPTIDRMEKTFPIQTTYERYTQLQACRYVDEIIPYDTEKDLENILSLHEFDVRFLGGDYNPANYPVMDSMTVVPRVTGLEICQTRGIDIVYLDRLHTYSSSDLRNRIKHV